MLDTTKTGTITIDPEPADKRWPRVVETSHLQDQLESESVYLEPKLLRVLQEREFERLGSTRTLRTDARLIAATDPDLKSIVDEQNFDPICITGSILGTVNICYFSHFRLALELPLFGWNGMLRIHRKANGEVVFTLSGEIDNEHVVELETLIAGEGSGRRVTLDLKDMTLTGQDGINFLAQCEEAGIALLNCDPHVRERVTRLRRR